MVQSTHTHIGLVSDKYTKHFQLYPLFSKNPAKIEFIPYKIKQNNTYILIYSRFC